MRPRQTSTATSGGIREGKDRLRQRLVQFVGAAATAGMLAASGGCAGLQSPPVDVKGMSVTDSAEDAVRFDIELAIENPGDEAITLREFHYTLRTASGARFVGRRAALATLQSGRRQTFTIPVVLSRGEVERAQGGAWTISGRLDYRTPGEVARVLYDAGLRRPRARFSDSGELPRIEPERPAADGP